VYDQNNDSIIDDPADFIEFYAKKNDGSFDTQMYANAALQPNVNYSLINDTAVYFLTFLSQSSSSTGLRLTIETDTSYSSYTQAPYFIKESYNEENNYYNIGDFSDNADYTEAEGWVGYDMASDGGDAGTSILKIMSTQNIYTGTSAPAIEVNTTVVGANNNFHNIIITSPNTSLINTNETFSGYQVKRYSYPPISGYSASDLKVSYYLPPPPPGYAVDHTSFVNLSVKYPHTMDLEGASTFSMNVPDGNSGKVYLPLTNFSTSPAVLYDVTNHKRITITQAGSTIKALVPNDGTGVPKFCYITSTSQIQSVNRVYPTNYNNSYGFNNFNSQSPVYAIDSAYIIITSGPNSSTNLLSAINQSGTGYKWYRDITTQNRVKVIDVDELYDQFAYGIKHHGLAIKKFAHFILDKWTVAPPQAIFLIGKSVQPDKIRNNPIYWAECLVASYGYPTSDNLLLTGINGSVWEPVIPIGRLSAQNTADVSEYLNKVRDYESAQNSLPQPWMKEVLHFGGGNDITQQNTFQYYLNILKGIIQDTLYGGHVTSYFKNSPDPIIINQSDSLQAKINDGVSFMKFFGHASGSSFDIATDLPENYRNYHKFPIVSASSCFAGNFHDVTRSIGEDFVLQPQVGAIAFLASVGTGYEYYLFRYDTTFYENLSYLFYGQSLGKIVQQTSKRLEAASPTDLRVKQVVNEMSIQGDPIIKFNSWTKPDYVALESNVFFSPNTIQSSDETFKLKFVTRNYARAVPDSFKVAITRTYPDGVDSVYTIPQAKCYYADTLQVVLPTGGVNGAGINNFKIKVDLDPDHVDELDNISNNQTTASLFIISNDITPIYPVKYAIHPYNTVTLKASTVNPFRVVRPYKFEIDTSYFNDNASTHSSYYRTGTISSAGGVVTWTPNLILQSNTVYYWRVYDDTATILKNESSFIHIPQKTGWSQAHFYQYKNDVYKNVVADSASRQFKFGVNLAQLEVDNYPFGGTSGYYLNNVLEEVGGGCTYNSHPNSGPAIMVAVIDSLTLQPWSNDHVDHGQLNQYFPELGITTCRPRAENYFIYPFNDPASFTRLHQWVDSIPNGYFLLFYSWGTYTYGGAPLALDSLMEELGNTQWPPTDNVAFVYVVKKGETSVLNFFKQGSSTSDNVVLDTLLQGQWYNGDIVTDQIGPSTRWTNFHWTEHALESGTTKDTARVNIMGFNQAMDRWDILISNLSSTVTDSSLSWINALQYPYLKLDAFVQDDSLRTPPQMNKWQIFYDEVPECALNPARQYSFYKDPIAEGDTIKMNIAIDNVGNLPMDSLEVSWYLYDRNRVRHNLKTSRLDSLRVGQSLSANIAVDSTFGLYGLNSLWVEANPYTTRHQLEQYHFNNLAEVKFNMSHDAINPILDVAFDGVHILDGDIVSGKPHIIIQLKDENKYLALNDTSDFRVYLKSPSANTETRLYFSTLAWSDSLHFIAARLPDNRCQINYAPILNEDGIYTLTVEATDASKNESGKYNYKITFEVINKSTITEVLNYPNPFTTSTRFVFVLTGNEVPDRLRIRIMTVTGKIVREIMKEELGNIHIGRNITDYAWDGKDEFGDRLANGVYIYKVVTDFTSGKEIDHRVSDADSYFTKGWGKMYLMR
jgi:hypothetical protein